MRSLLVVGLFAAQFLCSIAPLRSAPPKGGPTLEGKITKIVPATEAEKKSGLLATVFIKGSDVKIQISNKTVLRIQAGKLEDAAKVGDLKVDDRVSIWYNGVAKSDPPIASADHVIIFRRGKPDLPPKP